MFAKFLSLSGAVFSLFWKGDVPLSIAEKRRITCSFCTYKETTEAGEFCGACDCPRWFVSDLRTKTRMPDAACPLRHW